MGWVKLTVKNEFGKLVTNLSEFHKTYGKEKNQKAFDAIADACARALQLLAEEELSKTADVEMAGLLNILKTNINEVIRLKDGKENFQEFMKAIDATNDARTQFSLEFKKNFQEAEEKLKQQGKKSSEKLLEIFKKLETPYQNFMQLASRPSLSDEEKLTLEKTWKEIENIIIVIKNHENFEKILSDALAIKIQKKKEETKEYLTLETDPNHQGPGKQITGIQVATDEDIKELIKSIRACPKRNYTGTEFFKRTFNRAWMQHPKKMGVGTSFLAVGISYEVLSAFEQYAGPAINQLIHHAIHNEYVLGGTFILVGGTLATTALVKSTPKSAKVEEPKLIEVVVEPANYVLLENDSEETPLVFKEKSSSGWFSNWCQKKPVIANDYDSDEEKENQQTRGFGFCPQGK